MSTKKPSTFLDQRKSRHGDFKIQADISQALKRLVRGEAEESFQEAGTNTVVLNHWSAMSPHQQEALEMILHKVARIMAGDANYDDHWRDVGGYAFRVEETLERTIP